MAGIDYPALRREVSMDTVLKLLAFVPARRRGSQVRGACPIHGPKRPNGAAFSANLNRNAYRCFHCGSAGNQLDLWAAATRQPLYQAAKDLCEKLNHPTPLLQRRQDRRTKSAPPT
jgi:DNA primase